MVAGRLARDGKEALIAAPHVRPLERQVAGAAMILAGTATDIAAGWLTLAQSDARGVLLHVPAIMAWSLGLGIVYQHTPPAPRSEVTEPAEQEQTARRLPGWMSGGVVPEINERMLVALLLGLVLFPGMAPLGWCLGVCVAVAYRHSPLARVSSTPLAPPEAHEKEEASAPPATPLPLGIGEQLMRTSVEPLVDVVSDPDVEMRRGAIAILGKQSGSAAVELLRRFLGDEHADVRLDASVTLARLETHFARDLNEAAEQHAADATAARHFADVCRAYAGSGFLDEVSARFYYTEARAALRAYLAHAGEDAEGWIALARMHHALGEEAEALAALERACALSPRSPEAHLLGMEIAFHERAWTTLQALASAAEEALDASDPVANAARWWARPAAALEPAASESSSNSPGISEMAVGSVPIGTLPEEYP